MLKYNNLINRLYTYPITEKVKNLEENLIKNTLQNNGYDKNLVNPPPHTPEKTKTEHIG
jgi:hypothetical protein